LTPKISREVEITIDKLLAMIDTKRVATRYAQQTMDEEHLEILKELLSMEGVQLNGDERDSSTELSNVNLKL
jgi:hypothetical protein